MAIIPKTIYQFMKTFMFILRRDVWIKPSCLSAFSYVLSGCGQPVMTTLGKMFLISCYIKITIRLGFDVIYYCFQYFSTDKIFNVW